MNEVSQNLDELKKKGFTFFRSAFDDNAIERARSDVEALRPIHDFRGGLRKLANRSNGISQMIHSKPIRQILRDLKRGDAFLVRSILFDKTPGSNWKVAWHQDTKVPVTQRHNKEGFSAWSTKDGIVHVQPPANILEDMVTLRIHLDDTPKGNGALKVIPRSHTKGFIPQERIKEFTQSEHSCSCKAGDILVMSPLILHSSSPSELPSHRRVIHLEFATQELPSPLKWESV